MIVRLAKVAKRIDDHVEPSGISNSAGLAAWAAGNVAEVALVAALAGTELRTRSWRGLVRIASPIVVERLMLLGLDQVVDRDRPKRPSTRPAKMSPSSSSFPSGHASNAFLAATLLSTKVPAVVAYGLATVVAATRVVTRVHHPSDVVGGAIAGLAIGRAMNSVVPSDD